MGRAQGLLSPLQKCIETDLPTASYKVENETFLRTLEAQSTSRHPTALPFTIKFQLHRLVQNAILPLRAVRQLLAGIDILLTQAGPKICANAIGRLCNQLPLRCLQTDAAEADFPAVMDKLREIVSRLVEEELHGYDTSDLPDRAYIHRVSFTPSGMFLGGPDPENNNRVLRRYSQNHEFFVRVVFCDENS